MQRAWWIVLLLVACASVEPPPEPAIWNGLQPGANAVGFTTIALDSPPHRLQIGLWYPAASNDGKPLTWSDLYLLSLTEKTAEAPSEDAKRDALRSYAEMVKQSGLEQKPIDELFALRLFAKQDARPVRGRYPLVLLAQGNGQSAVHQSVLAEFLASHGYVVATVPSITRLTGPIESVEELRAKVFAEADDLRRAYDAVVATRNVDTSRVAVIGHSLGARSALLFAMRTPVDALVSLDGGIGTALGSDLYPRAEQPLPPILHFYEDRDERMKPDFTLLRSLPGEELRVEKVNHLQHLHFTSLGFAAGVIPDLAAATAAGPRLPDDLRLVASGVLSFLDQKLK